MYGGGGAQVWLAPVSLLRVCVRVRRLVFVFVPMYAMCVRKWWE